MAITFSCYATANGAAIWATGRQFHVLLERGAWPQVIAIGVFAYLVTSIEAHGCRLFLKSGGTFFPQLTQRLESLSGKEGQKAKKKAALKRNLIAGPLVVLLILDYASVSKTLEVWLGASYGKIPWYVKVFITLFIVFMDIIFENMAESQDETEDR